MRHSSPKDAILKKKKHRRQKLNNFQDKTKRLRNKNLWPKISMKHLIQCVKRKQQIKGKSRHFSILLLLSPAKNQKHYE